MDRIQKALILAREKHDAVALEEALHFDNKSEFNVFHTDILCQLLLEDWHEHHEDILMTLDNIKDPQSIPAIVQSLHLKLDYYTGNEIPRKAIWALRSINTSEAINEIEKLTHASDEFTREHALKTLRTS